MESEVQGFWEGKASAISAAREKARELVAGSKWSDVGKHAEAESVLASAHYSRAGTLRTRGFWWLPFVLWHFWRARVHVRALIGYGISGLSPDQLDIAGTILKKGPFPDIKKALECFRAGIPSPGVLAKKQKKIAPHTLALLEIGIAECYEQQGDRPSAQLGFENVACHGISDIEKEESDIAGKRQLVRVLKRCGAYFKRIGDPRGDEFLARAEKLAEEVSPDQLAKIKAGI